MYVKGMQEAKFTAVPNTEDDMDGKAASKKKGKKEKKVDLDNLKRELEMVNIHDMLITSRRTSAVPSMCG